MQGDKHNEVAFWLETSSVRKQMVYAWLANWRVAVPATSFQLKELNVPDVELKYCKHSAGALIKNSLIITQSKINIKNNLLYQDNWRRWVALRS